LARYLFVVPPLVGHVNPTVSVGRELERRAHEVAWVGPKNLVAPLLPPGSRLLSAGEDIPPDMAQAARTRAHGLRGVAALEFLWKDFLLPLASAMVGWVDAAVDDFRPDVMVVDQQALAGAVVARQRGLRWATSATTSAELVDPFALLPKLGDWVRRHLVELQIDLGVKPEDAARGDLRFSEQLVIAFTTEALAGDAVSSRPQTALVGPALEGRASGEMPAGGDPFPWDWLEQSGPTVLVSLGTVNAEIGGRFFGAVLEAFSGSGTRAVIVAPPGLIGQPPTNVLVRPSVAQLALLDRVDAVVCHAGHNTVCESLSRGIPLVVAPIRDDQPVVADQVVRAGAGIRIRFGRVRGRDVRAAVDEVLNDGSYRAGARRVQASFAAAGGARVAADRLEALAA
jgi:UDP:flavonoid glycosyltransferase YjiC (YdhE family)